MAVALKPWLKALQAREPLSPLLFSSPSLDRGSFFLRLFCSHPLSPSKISSFWNNLVEWKRTKAANMARSTFCLCASHRTRSGEEGRGGGVTRLAGSWVSSNIKVWSSVLCLVWPSWPGDVTNVLDYQVLDGAIKWSDGSFFSQKR